MSNVFLTQRPRDIDTALLLEQAIIVDLKDHIACTDGDKVFLNTEENLERLLPNYNKEMLKWLLWHEAFHKELFHHRRFHNMITGSDEQLSLSLSEVNIIMDILVHDSLSKMFPELIENARVNGAQLRNSNSLKHTFKTHTLEEMIKEYDDAKHEDPQEEQGQEGQGGEQEQETGEKQEEVGSPQTQKGEPSGKHDEVDWSQFEHIDTDNEFISEIRAKDILENINRLNIDKIRLGNLTHKLNSLATTTRARTYSIPSYIHTGSNIILKGRTKGKTPLYLCFDASGSMRGTMNTFKKIISNSIPHAMSTPTRWFSGQIPSQDKIRLEEKDHYDYYLGTFADFMNAQASSGYSDDGDRTIEMCAEAEEQGYSPIGITDGGGKLSWSTDTLKKLKATTIVTTDKDWSDEVKEVNPYIQVIVL